MKGDLVYILVISIIISTDCYQYCYQYSYVLVLVIVLVLSFSSWLLLSLGISWLVVRSGKYCIFSLHITIVIIRISMITIRIMLFMYCITYDMLSITSCSALFDYVLLYVIFRFGYITLWFVILYCIVLYYSIIYLCFVLRIIFYVLEAISRAPKRTSLRIIYNMIQSWGWNVTSETFDVDI